MQLLFTCHEFLSQSRTKNRSFYLLRAAKDKEHPSEQRGHEAEDGVSLPGSTDAAASAGSASPGALGTLRRWSCTDWIPTFLKLGPPDKSKNVLPFYQGLLLSVSSVLIKFLVQLRADTQLPMRTGSSRAPISLCINNKLIVLLPQLY